MRKMKQKYAQTALYVLLLVAVVAAMGLTRRCTARTQLPALTSGGSAGDTVDVAIVYGPLSYYLYADTVGGLNHDMLRRFAADTGKPMKMWPIVNLNEALRLLEDGTYDMLASLPSDNTIKQRFLTTESVFLDRLVLLQLADSLGHTQINSALDLAADTVYIQGDSPAGARIANLSNEIGAPIVVTTEDNLSEEYLCMKVASGDIGLAVVNEKTAIAMKKRYPALSYDNPVSFTQFQVWLINPSDSSLRDDADKWLSGFRSSEDYRMLLRRYAAENSDNTDTPHSNRQ